MAEKYRFFDAVQDENGQYDREYNAQEFTDYFKALVTTGVMKGAGNELAVAANGSNMITTVNTGIAFLLGRYYENDSPLTLTHDTETIGNSRIDRIVVRMDLATEARYVKAFIKKGVPSANPVAPSLVQTANLFEISLAQVRIVGGQTFIASNAVADERGKDVICPWAGSRILPNFDNQALADLINKVDTSLVDASTSQKGIVQLNNTVTSASATQAATANAVKQVNDKLLDTGWINLSPNFGWVVNGHLRYRKKGDLVTVQGWSIRAETGYSIIILNLPAGFRPYSNGYVGLSNTNLNKQIFLAFGANGNVNIDPAYINNFANNILNFEITFLQGN